MRHIIVSSLLRLLSATQLQAQMPLVQDGKSTTRIIISTDDTADKEAARLLQTFVKKISGAELPVLQNVNARKNDIVIGNGNQNRQIKINDLTEDGFRITNTDGILHIVSGGGKGSISGAVTLLEHYMGVGYWGENRIFVATRCYNRPPSDKYSRKSCIPLPPEPELCFGYRFRI